MLGQSTVNPYRDWLGIQGPVQTYYELLGVAGTEAADVLAARFHSRYSTVRKYQIGQYEDEAQKLLSELSTAYKCLSDPPQRAAYDRRLGELQNEPFELVEQPTIFEESSTESDTAEPLRAAEPKVRLTNSRPAALPVESSEIVTAEVVEIGPAASHRQFTDAELKQAFDGWSRQVEEGRPRVRAAHKAIARHRLRATTLFMGLRALQLLRWTRRIPTTIGTPWVVVLSLFAAGLFALALFATLKSFGAQVFPILLLEIAAAGSLMLFYALVFPGASLSEAIDDLRESRDLNDRALAEARHDHEAATGHLSMASNQLERVRAMVWARVAQVERERQLREISLRRERLLSREWRWLHGAEFEAFLVELLLLNGYRIETMRGQSDLGVNLIATRNAIRVAIQGRGYSASPVDLDAVQRAHANGKYWQCHRAAVVTNSTFTDHAQFAAGQIGCALIDANTLAEVAYDRIHLA